MKAKKYEPVNYIAVKENKRILASLVIAILLIFITLQVGIIMKCAIELIKLNSENEDLKRVIETQSSMIADIQEDNLKLQEMIK